LHGVGELTRTAGGFALALAIGIMAGAASTARADEGRPGACSKP